MHTVTAISNIARTIFHLAVIFDQHVQRIPGNYSHTSAMDFEGQTNTIPLYNLDQTVLLFIPGATSPNGSPCIAQVTLESRE